jgi:rhamnulokinase
VSGLRQVADTRVAVISVGIDTWGVDFGLLDESGQSLFAPYHYRHPRTEGWPQKLSSRIDPARMFSRTGVQPQAINTLCQLCALCESDPELVKRARHLLMMPSLFVYWLTGFTANEFTIATTSQCFDPSCGDWAIDLLQEIGLPTHFLDPIVPPATKVGQLSAKVSSRTQLSGIDVVLPASHDTASAVAAIPAASTDFAFISSGTWSLMGMLVPRPVTSDQARILGFTNEGGAEGNFRLLRNIPGLWLLQRCQLSWTSSGRTLDYAEIVDLAVRAQSGTALFDPEHPTLVLPDDMPSAIRALCRESGQAVPEDIGTMARVIFESMACKYRQTLDRLAQLTGTHPSVIHVVGGGSRNALLCQLTADVCRCSVLAGPTETTALGNVLSCAIACGTVTDFGEGRRLVSLNHAPTDYQPTVADWWNDLYARYEQKWA